MKKHEFMFLAMYHEKVTVPHLSLMINESMEKITGWLTGEEEIGLDDINKISRALNIDTKYFMDCI